MSRGFINMLFYDVGICANFMLWKKNSGPNNASSDNHDKFCVPKQQSHAF